MDINLAPFEGQVGVEPAFILNHGDRDASDFGLGNGAHLIPTTHLEVTRQHIADCRNEGSESVIVLMTPARIPVLGNNVAVREQIIESMLGLLSKI